MSRLCVRSFSVSLDGFGQYLEARLVDELHLALTPVLLGSGEPLSAGIDPCGLGYRCTEHVTTPAAMHVAQVSMTGRKERPRAMPRDESARRAACTARGNQTFRDTPCVQ